MLFYLKEVKEYNLVKYILLKKKFFSDIDKECSANTLFGDWNYYDRGILFMLLYCLDAI
jgi:hypothetical protein